MGFIRIGDCDLFYDEKGGGTPILLIHPAGSTAGTWGVIPESLCEFGRVIFYDRRGYGRSRDATVRSVDTHTRDAAAVLERLATTAAVLVGTSAGATIALDLVVRRPDLVRAVVVHEAPWRALHHPGRAALVTLTRMEWLARSGRYPEAAETLLRQVYAYRDGGSAWDAFPEEWRRIGRDSGRSVVADLRSTLGGLAGYPRAAALAGITVPTVCTYGGRSADYMVAVTRALARAIPTARLREIDGAGHAVPFDAPAAFVDVIVETIRDSGRC